MNKRERLEIGTIDEQQRRQVVIDYISEHKGCRADDIVKGQTIVGRGKVFRILADLKKEGVVIPEQSAKNRRDIKLFLKDDHPFVSLPRELKEFKKYFYPLIDRATKIRIGYWKKELFPSFEALANCLVVFFELMRMSNYRALLIWSRQIKDAETLSKLFKIFYSEMANLHLEVIEKFRPALQEDGLEDDFLGVARDVASELLIPQDFHFDELEQSFKYFLLKKQANPVLKHLTKIRNEIFATQVLTKIEQYESSDKFRKDQLIIEKASGELARRFGAAKPTQSRTKTIRNKWTGKKSRVKVDSYGKLSTNFVVDFLDHPSIDLLTCFFIMVRNKISKATILFSSLSIFLV